MKSPLKTVSVALIALVTASLFSSPAQAVYDIAIDRTTFGAGVASNVGITLTGFDQTQNYQATVKFVNTATNLDVTNGTLSATQSGTSLVPTYLSYSSTKLGFKGTYAQVAAALASVTWTPTSASGDISIRIGIVPDPGAGNFYDANSGSYYKYVSSSVSWAAARAAAENTYLNGLRGYLAEINSAAENNFIGNETTATNIWIGATEDATTTASYQGTSYNGSSGQRWIWQGAVQTPLPTGSGTLAQSNLAAFSSWANAEPNNDSRPGQDCAVTNWNNRKGEWNDLQCGHLTGYLIEFGGRSGETLSVATRTLTQTVVAREAVTLGSFQSNISCTFDSNCVSPLSLTNPTAKNSSNVDVPGTFTYSSSNTASSTVSNVSGGATVSVVGAGSSTIMATFTPTNTNLYAGSTKSFTITVSATAPAAPTGLVATASNGSVSLSWTPGSSGGSTITDYLIEYSADGSTWTTFTDGTSSSTSATVTVLTNGTTYSFRVSAINSVNTGSASTAVSATPNIPPTPTGLSATPGNASVSLNWTAGTYGGPAVTDYVIEYSIDGTTWVTFSDGTSTTATATVSGLNNGTSYFFRVSASNSLGTSVSSSVVSSTPVAPITPVAPVATPTSPSAATPTPTQTATPRPTANPRPTPSPTPTRPEVNFNRPVAIPSGSVVSVTTGSGATQQVTIGSSGLPELRPLQSLALVAGAPVPVQVTQVASNTALKIDGGEFNVTLSASSAAGTSSSLNSLGELILTSGNFATFSGTGFAPNSEIVVWLFSTPTKLGTVVTDASGSFSGSLAVPSDLEAGQHTVQLNGETSDGETRSLAVGVELVAEQSEAEPTSEEAAAASIGATGDDNAPPVPFDPLSSPEGVTALTATIGAAAAAAGAIAAAAGAAAGAAGSSSGGSARGGASSGGGNSGGDSGSIATIDAAHERYRNNRRGRGDRWKIWKKRWLNFLDKPFISLAVKSARFSPLFSKISVDGAYLRASMGSLGLLPTIAAAFISAFSVSMNETAVAPPQWQWFIALAVIGIFDAFAGLIGTSVFVIGTIIMHGAIGIEDTRLLLGVMIVGYGPALLANAFRAFRKEPENSEAYWWDRLIDLAVLPFIGGWITATMISTLPALAGTTLAVANHVDTFAFAVAAAIMLRVILEELVARWFPKRLDTLHPTDVEETDPPQKWISVAFRLSVFIFVTAALMGNVWQVWVGSALFILPTIIGFYSDKFKNFPWIWRLLPTGVPGLAVALLVASATTSVVGMWFGASPDLALWSFALLPIPMLFLALLGMFGREGVEDEVRFIQRPQLKWVYRIGGIIMLLVTMNLAGVI